MSWPRFEPYHRDGLNEWSQHTFEEKCEQIDTKIDAVGSFSVTLVTCTAHV